jgi:hypothetical protein
MSPDEIDRLVWLMLAEQSAEYAAKRTGTPHEERIVRTVFGDRTWCNVCGWIDDADPDDPVVREWHGDSFDLPPESAVS